jgi:hypothetical protein
VTTVETQSGYLQPTRLKGVVLHLSLSKHGTEGRVSSNRS